MRRLRKVFKKPAELDGIIPKDIIGRYLPPDPTIIEAGAHVGVDTVEMARVWPKSKIYAFEPVPAVYKQLSQNVKGYSNIKIYQLALSDKTGKQKIFISGGRSDGSSSLLKPKEHIKVHPDVTFEQTLEINATTLEDWVHKNNIPEADFLWLDMQGLELAVMKASSSVIKKAKAIYTEVSLIETYENTPTYKELKGWLGKQGFRPEIERFPWDDMGNVLFVRR